MKAMHTDARIVLCAWCQAQSKQKCLSYQEGNPFKPFWDELEVDFDEKIVYHLGIHVQDPYERVQWQKK